MLEQVDFYLLETAVSEGKLKLACRLTNKLHNMRKRIIMVCEDKPQLKNLDGLLWRFSDTSFIPHQIVDDQTAMDCEKYMVHLTLAEGLPHVVEDRLDVVINLTSTLLPDTLTVARRAELIECDEADKQAARGRYKHYVDAGTATNVHRITL
ncbi:MAG: DNA polymerase III subunit chi [Proteobacteria bacterium]|jgi:DNA polymerase III subunit chi|nr:DNA polymerase III subunit chi [Pseudomonadota bacterium]